jgi:L-iditol 2-dehydrogenase
MHRDGAYADYVTVDPRHLHPVPDGVPLQDAAITEPTSIATRAVLSQSDVLPGDEVLVEGPGPIGVLVAVVADSIGANVVVSGLGQDAKSRLPKVERMGIETVNIEQTDVEEYADDRTGDIGFDVVFDTTGHRSGVETGIDVVRKGGQIVVVGLPADPSEVFMTPVVRGEIDVNTSYGSKWKNFEQALRLMENGTIDAQEIIDTSFSVEDPATAFEAFLNSEVIKPVFSFTES